MGDAGAGARGKGGTPYTGWYYVHTSAGRGRAGGGGRGGAGVVAGARAGAGAGARGKGVTPYTGRYSASKQWQGTGRGTHLE